jgi:hypothetical protein
MKKMDKTLHCLLFFTEILNKNQAHSPRNFWIASGIAFAKTQCVCNMFFAKVKPEAIQRIFIRLFVNQNFHVTFTNQ